MILSGQPRLLRVLALTTLAVVALASAPGASAQTAPVPRKDPQGPFVISPPAAPLRQIEPGRSIQWVIGPISNLTPSAGVFNFFDELDGDDLDGNPVGECETGNPGRGDEIPASQSWLDFPDDGDGTCDGSVTVDAPASGYTIICDVATRRLEVRNINLGAFQNTTIRFVTNVSPLAQVADQVCNWGHIRNAIGTGGSDLYPYGTGNVAGCSCLQIAPPSGFDADFTKSAAIVPPATRLIPGAADALIQYTMTVTNTGTEDINNGQFVDVVGGPTVAEGRGLEWVTIDDAGPLTCNLDPTNTRLTCTGINLLSADPDESVTVKATARVTCAAATDIDNGEVCNQANFSFPGQPGAVGSDDPDTPAVADGTCLPVVWNNLTTSQKFVDGYDDANRNGQLDLGERVNFRIRARNSGTLVASRVVVTDDLSSSSCLDPASITALDGGIVAGGVITWNVGDLAPGGGSVDVRFSALITADALCCNQGSVQCSEREGCGQRPILTDDDATSEDPAVAPPDATCIAPGPQPDLQIDKTVALSNDVNGNGQFDVGDRVRWTVTITNNGAGAATTAELRDVLSICMRNFQGAAGVTLTTSDGTDAGDASCSRAFTPPVDPGEVCVQSLGGANGILSGETVTVEFEGQISGQVNGCCNQATVTYAESATPAVSDDPATPGLVDDRTCLIAPPCEPTGQLAKVVGRLIDGDADARLEVGEGIEYVLTFTNVGCGDLTNIRIQDASSACLGVDITSIVVNPPGGVTNNSAAGTLDLTIAGPLAPTASVSITFRATGLAVGACCNQASWTTAELPAGGRSDADPADFTPEQPTCNDWLEQNGGGCTGEPELVMRKTASATACVEIGTVVDYTLTVENVGACEAASFTITDVLPAGLTDVVADPPLSYDAASNTVSVTGSRLDPGTSRDYTFHAKVPCAGNGTVTNTARVAYVDSTGAPLESSDSATVTFGSPNLSTSTKAAVPNRGADGVLDGGDTVDFTITVRNTGTCDALNVIVRDTFPAATWNLAGATIGQGGTVTLDEVMWDSTGEPTLARIAPGGSVVLTITVPVSAAVTTETRVTNTADIQAKGNDQSGCGGTNPSAAPVSAEICIECAPIVTTGQKLLANNRAVRADALRLDQLGLVVFNNLSPNVNTCGETGLDVADGALEISADVTATLAAGIVIPAADARIVGDLVYIEVSERCQVDEGGTADPIFVCKARTSGDLTVRSSATPLSCP